MAVGNAPTALREVLSIAEKEKCRPALIVVIMAANTSFAGFPRLSALLAADGFLPRQFTYRGSRLVYSRGIMALALFASLLIVLFQDYGLFPAFLLALIVALLFGLTNGFLVTYLRLPAFVVTLATLQIGSSIAKVLSGGGAVYTGYEGTLLPEGLTEFFKGSISGIPNPLIVCVLFLGLIAFYQRTSTGHFAFPVGGNQRAVGPKPCGRQPRPPAHGHRRLE